MGVVAGGCLRGASFAHMARTATEARTKGTTKWITEHVAGKAQAPERSEEAPQGALPRTKGPRGQVLPASVGHAATGSYLCDKIKKLSSKQVLEVWNHELQLQVWLQLNNFRRLHSMLGYCLCVRDGVRPDFPDSYVVGSVPKPKLEGRGGNGGWPRIPIG